MSPTPTDDTVAVLAAEWTEPPCPICGVIRSKSDCFADEGYGCPDWEGFKEANPQYDEDASIGLAVHRAVQEAK